jgi:hypothetical protein
MSLTFIANKLIIKKGEKSFKYYNISFFPSIGNLIK